MKKDDVAYILKMGGLLLTMWIPTIFIIWAVGMTEETVLLLGLLIFITIGAGFPFYLRYHFKK